MRFKLIELQTTLAVCRLDPSELSPEIAASKFFSVTRTADELSVVCPEALAPEHATIERGWRAFRVDGVLDFSLIGILAELTRILADVGISVFAISTYDTDYLLVKSEHVTATRDALTAAGHHPV